MGRGSEIESARVLAARTRNGLTGRSLMLHGVRGVGKTVLLRALQHELDRRGWLTVAVEAQRDPDARALARQQLERGLLAGARRLASRSERLSDTLASALSTLTSFSLSVGAGVTLGANLQPARGRADTGVLELDLVELVEDLAPALRDAGTGLAVFVDEIQDLEASTLTALLAVQHQAAQQGWPFSVFGAGLPSVPAVLSEARSYAERQFEYRSIDRLGADDATEAFAGPARTAGASFTPEALTLLVDASGGYPYFVQELGFQAWQLAPGPDLITDDDARLAASAGIDALDAGFFRARWERATRAEQRFMRAMAADHDAPSLLTDLVERLRKRKPSDLSVARRDLISKGLIYASARAELAFTAPHMASYINRRHGEG
ncbi:ATP-binding protein [Cellulomonas oligotrophica]|uniref:ATPase n=1 Tax=Cellulomonas oligotrophica TaxID=931536 RepID=A0ABQ4DA55_9CELL|nr:ATP-binding protein [Cellulomonas oligotrophica]GIG32611.1 ATPase [Cellulomonas oligotrophica]